MEPSEFDELKHRALRLLASREHSRWELHRKLRTRAADDSLLEQLLDDLEAEGSLSDRRYTESYVDARRRKGFGPLRIRQELQERGVDRELIQHCLDEGAHDWDAHLDRVLQRKFGTTRPSDYRARAKQARFLEYRGFPPERIRARLLDGA